MAHMNGLFEVEMRGERGQVISVVIHVVAAISLRGAPVSAAVVGNDAIAIINEEQHMRLPIIGRERPAVTEDDWLPLSPVLVIDLRTILGCDRRHEGPPLSFLSCIGAQNRLHEILECSTKGIRKLEKL